MMSFSFTARRRAKALPQLAALALSVSVAFQASLCPPGMDSGMDMADADSPGMMDGRPAGHEAGTHCRFAGSSDEDGRPTCPFSVGGIGPCGTTAPAPSVTLDALLTTVLRQPPVFVHLMAREDTDLRIPPRPPRA